MSATKTVKAVGSKVNPVNSTHKRWVSFVVVAQFALPWIVGLLNEKAPDLVPVIGPIIGDLAGLLQKAGQ